MLIIEYRLIEARAHRGYTFTTPTDGLPPDIVKAIWRQAMPRGGGWGAYVGARSLKCFALPDGHYALAETVVTDQRDDAGRPGIRRAEIALHSLASGQTALRARLAALPAETVAQAERMLTSREWELLLRKHRDLAAQPSSLLKPQTILAMAYSAATWPYLEACLLLLVTRTTLLANLIEVSPAINPFADRILPFTTLALDHRDETRLIGMPLAQARAARDLPYIALQ
jgi:hypothetical protein